MTEFAPIFPEIVDDTMREAFSVCPTKFNYAHIRGISSSSINPHLHFGAAYAAGLNAYRDLHYKDVDLLNSLAAGFRAIILSWGEEEAELDPAGYKTLYRCLELLLVQSECPEFNESPFLPLLAVDGAPALEFTFALPLEVDHPITGNPLIYAGRLDGLFYHPEQPGYTYPLDDKTTKQLGDQWSRQWDMRSQFEGYCYAIREHGYKPTGVIVRGHCILKASYSFREHVIIPIPNWRLERWWKQINDDFSRAVTNFKTNHWPLALNTNCNLFNGCSFKPLCSAKSPDRWLAANFIERRWNPLA